MQVSAAAGCIGIMKIQQQSIEELKPTISGR